MNQLVCKELQPPTSVSHSVFARFTGFDEVNLCVAKSTRLDIYVAVSQSDDNDDDSDGSEAGFQLRLRDSFQLYGNVETLNVVHFSSADAKSVGETHGFDALLLTFGGSKCSLVAYDAVRDNLRTISLHNFAASGSGYGAEVRCKLTEQSDQADRAGLSLASVDPLGRCAAVMGTDDQILIIPFRQSNMGLGNVSTEEDSEIGLAMPQTLKPSASSLVLEPYVISLSSKQLAGSVKDMTFLHGYFEPTLLILQEEPIQTWTGGLSTVSNTSKLVALSINLFQRHHPSIWNFQGLPYDSISVVAVPDPVGGVLVISSSALLYFNQNHRCGVATNGYATVTVDKKVCPVRPNEKRYRLVLNPQTQCCFVNSRCALLTADTGDIYCLHLETRTNSVTNMAVKRTGANASIASAMSHWSLSNGRTDEDEANGAGIVFLGSWLGDSSLWLCSFTEDTGDNLVKDASNCILPQKRPLETSSSVSTAQEQANTMDDDDDEDDDDAFLYASAPTSTSNEPSKQSESTWNRGKTIQLRPCDALVNLGPVNSLAVRAGSNRTAESAVNVDELGFLEIMSSAGYGDNSGVAQLQAGMRCESLSSFALKGGRASGAWALNLPGFGSLSEDQCLLLSVGKKTKAIVFENDQMRPVSEHETSLILDEATIHAGSVSQGKCVIQVLPQAVQMYWAGEETSPLQLACVRIDFEKNISPPLVSIQDPYVVIGFDDGEIVLLVPTAPKKFKKKTLCTTERKLSCLRIFVDVDMIEECPNKLKGKPYVRPPSPKLMAAGRHPILDANQLPHLSLGVDEDEVVEASLYGTGIMSTKISQNLDSSAKSDICDSRQTTSHLLKTEEEDEEDYKSLPPEIYLIVGYEDGSLQFLSLPSGDVMFDCVDAASGVRVLSDTAQSLSGFAQKSLHINEDSERNQASDRQTPKTYFVMDVALAYLGDAGGEEDETSTCSMLVMSLVLNTGDLLLYKRHPQPDILYEHRSKERLPLAFVRSDHAVITRPPRNVSQNSNEQQLSPQLHPRVLTVCPNVNGKYMIFCNTYCPVWITSSLGFLRTRCACITNSSMSTLKRTGASNRQVDAFTPLNNGHCENGVLAVRQDGIAVLAELQDEGSSYLDDRVGTGQFASLGGHKRLVGETVHHVLALPREGEERQSYVIITSKQISGTTYDDAIEQEQYAAGAENFSKLVGDDELEVLGGVPPPKANAFFVKLVVFSDDEVTEDVVADRDMVVLQSFALDDHERALCVSLCGIYDHAAKAVLPFLCVGTGFVFPQGSARAGLGKVLAFEINGDTFNLKHSMHMNGGITAMNAVRTQHVSTDLGYGEGTLLVAAEGKVNMVEIQHDRLQRVGFFYSKVVVTSMSVVKDFIVCADMYNSVQFLLWKPNEKEIDLLGWDPYLTKACSSNYMTQAGDLGIIISSMDGNLFVLEYKPKQSIGDNSNISQPLDSVSGVRIGSRVTTLASCPFGMSSEGGQDRSLSCYGCVYGTADGSIGIVMPFYDYKIYLRLVALQCLLTNALEQNAGLNPREFRSTKSAGPQGNSRPRFPTSLDMSILLKYISLEFSTQRSLARSVGTNPDIIFENLRLIEDILKA